MDFIGRALENFAIFIHVGGVSASEMTDNWDRVCVGSSSQIHIAGGVLEKGSTHHPQHGFLLFVDNSKSADGYLVQHNVLVHSFFHLLGSLAHSQAVLAEHFGVSEDDKFNVRRVTVISARITDLCEEVG